MIFVFLFGLFCIGCATILAVLIRDGLEQDQK